MCYNQRDRPGYGGFTWQVPSPYTPADGVPRAGTRGDPTTILLYAVRYCSYFAEDDKIVIARQKHEYRHFNHQRRRRGA